MSKQYRILRLVAVLASGVVAVALIMLLVEAVQPSVLIGGVVGVLLGYLLRQWIE